MGICVVVEGPPSAFESLDDVFSFFSFLFSGGDHDKIDAVFPPKTFGDTLMLLLVAPISPPVFFPKKKWRVGDSNSYKMVQKRNF